MRASNMIRYAVAATRWRWPDVPPEGMVTFVKADAIRSSNPGYCFLAAGFRKIGKTKAQALVVLHLDPADMPDPEPPLNVTLPML